MKKILNNVMVLILLSKNNFFRNLDKFRSPHLWKKDNDVWSLRNVAWDDAEKSNVLTTNQDQSAVKWQGNKNT